MSVVRLFWHGRRYGAARMLINDEDPDNMQRHGSVKPVCCCFLCILIDPSLLFNMTAAPRATVRPALCYLAVWCTLCDRREGCSYPRVFSKRAPRRSQTPMWSSACMTKPACCFFFVVLFFTVSVWGKVCVYVLKVTLNRNMWGRIVLFAW